MTASSLLLLCFLVMLLCNFQPCFALKSLETHYFQEFKLDSRCTKGGRNVAIAPGSGCQTPDPYSYVYGPDGTNFSFSSVRASCSVDGKIHYFKDDECKEESYVGSKQCVNLVAFDGIDFCDMPDLKKEEL